MIKMVANAFAAYKMRWKIENISQLWWLKKGEKIESPASEIDALEGTKWLLRLYPVGNTDENCVSFFLIRKEDCSGPFIIKVSLQLSFLGKDGSILRERTVEKHQFTKGCSWGFSEFERRERVFITEKEAFLPEDTLTVECTIWITDEKPANSNNLFATTGINVKRRSFVWKIDNPSIHISGISNKFRDNLIDFDLVLNGDFNNLKMVMTPSVDDNIKYISCNTSVIDAEGSTKNCGIKKYFSGDLSRRVISSTLFLPTMLLKNKSRYFSNNVLSLELEFVLITLEHSSWIKKSSNLAKEVVGKDECLNTAVLKEDFKSLYKDGIFSDMQLRTSTKTFEIHKAILSARSPVFRNMFSHDMKEKNCGYVEITDFEDDTIQQMLQYIYTDSIENLQFESASKLYVAADKYEILSLKSVCSSFLKEDLCPTNACQALILADLHNDDELRSSVLDYILGLGKEVFYLQEWKDLMKTHPKLAADLMYAKITDSKMNLPRKRKSEAFDP